jgi:steroid 5-alpha reductase family enzyme
VTSTVTIAALAATAGAIAAAVMAALWKWHLQLHRGGIADAAWPIVTAVLAVLYANVANGAPARQSAIAWMIGSWGARLGVYLLWDDVFARPADETRREPLWHFERRAIEAVFFSLPALFASVDPAPTLSVVELAASGIWLVGFAGETTADRQFVRWRRAQTAAADASAEPAPQQTSDAVCRVGVWRYVPRAHDVFELITWSAHALFASASPFGWLSAACPLFVAYRLAAAGTRRAQL